jgi:hypothetical protein
MGVPHPLQRQVGRLEVTGENTKATCGCPTGGPVLGTASRTLISTGPTWLHRRCLRGLH